MTDKEKLTEDKIAEAAREVFVEKGMDGARMQEIADRAGINKALLHYYFRSKEKLFNFIAGKLLSRVGNMFSQIMKEGVSIEEKLTCFADTYIDILLENPFLPNFILNAATRNPEFILALFQSAEIKPEEYFVPLSNQLKAEGYNIEPHEFMVNSISLVIFPVAMRPMLQHIFFQGDKKAYNEYILTRKLKVVKFVMAALEGYRN